MPAEEATRLLADGKRFEHGIGRPQDLDRAVEHYCRAGAMGSGEARYHLGWLYLTGRLGEVDEVLAAGWFSRAARLRHSLAEQQLQRLGVGRAEMEAQARCVQRADMVARRIEERPSPTAEPAETDEPRPFTVRELDRSGITALVHRLAPEYRLDPALVLAVIAVESNFNPGARSGKNAQGLMQLIPATARRFGVANVWDPVQNLRGGMAYLRWLLDEFNGNLSLALAGYNAGEQAVRRHGGIPPFNETRLYVQRVHAHLKQDAGEAGLLPGLAQRRARFLSPPNAED